MSFGVAWTLAYASAVASTKLGERFRQAAWVLPCMGLALLWVYRDATPTLKLLASSLLFLYLVKGAAASRQRLAKFKPIDLAICSTLWPGLDLENVSKRADYGPDTGRRFDSGLTCLLLGLFATLAIALASPYLSEPLVGWLAIGAFLLTVHFGVADILTSLMWLSGRPVLPLFDRPLASRSLSEFWTKRWNLAFVQMERRLFMPWLSRTLGLRLSVYAAFLISGLLHEIAISYPAGAGWGGPLLYFAVQALGVSTERSLRFRSRIWTYVVVLLPLPLLFHAPFRSELVLPLLSSLRSVIVSHASSFYASSLLWMLGYAQLAVLLASSQVPSRLQWRAELARLSPFNRKLMWAYGGFVVTTILSFAVLTFTLHKEFLLGERSAVALALFMGSFWALRLIYDAAYFKSDDWPPGELMKVGHTVLNALFSFLALGYGAVAIYGLLQAGRLSGKL